MNSSICLRRRTRGGRRTGGWSLAIAVAVAVTGFGVELAAADEPPPPIPAPAPTPTPAAAPDTTVDPAQRYTWQDPVPESAAAVELTLDDCVNLALRNNLDLIESQLSDQSAATGVIRAEAAFDPNLSLAYTHSADTDNTPTSSDSSTLTLSKQTAWGQSVRATARYTNNVNGVASSDSQSADAGISLTQPIWKNAGRLSAESDLTTARLNRVISANDLLAQVQQLSFNVRTAFNETQTLQQELEVNRNAVRRARAFLLASQTRKQAGAISLLDVRNAEVQLANSELALIRSQRQLAGQLDQLKILLNLPLDGRLTIKGDLPSISGAKPADENGGAAQPAGVSLTNRLVVDAANHRVVLEELAPGVIDPAAPPPPGEEPPPIVTETILLFSARPLDYERDLRQAYARRLSLQNAAQRFEISYLNYQVAVGDDTAALSVTGAYNRNGSDTEFGRALRLNQDDWSLTVNYSLPLGRRADRASVESARLNLERNYWTWVEERRNVETDVRNVLRDLRQAELSIYSQAQAVEQTRFAFQGTLVELNNGTLDSFDFIQAESRLLDAETGLVRSIQSYKNLVFRLALVTGEPLELPELIEKYRQVVPQTLADHIRLQMESDARNAVNEPATGDVDALDAAKAIDPAPAQP